MSHPFRFLLLLLLLVGPTLQGQTMERLTPESVQNLLKEAGMRYEADDAGAFLLKIGPAASRLVLASDGASLLFTATAEGEASQKRINQWNASTRYSKSYLAADGTAVLALDLDLAGGVTKARLIDFLQTCQTSLEQWLDKVVR